MIDTLGTYLASGGFVSGPLILIGLVLWYLIALRALSLRYGLPLDSLDARLIAATRGEGPPLGDGVLARALQVASVGLHEFRVVQAVRSALDDQAQRLAWGRNTIRVLVAVAPLLGLLGTVTGMIETFASLADMTLYSRSGGIAGGISEALVSTQLGLVVAIPGILAGRVLDQREQRIRWALEQVSEFVQVHATKAEAA